MKKINFLILTFTYFFLTSCSNSPTDKAQSSVQSYLKENLKNSVSYESISFSKLDTLKKSDTSATKQISLYYITHFYSILNSEKDKVRMTISFLLDKDLKVNESDTKSINGDCGALTGNVFWKYNDYVGNKADAGAKIILYSLDTIRGNLKYETTADVQGNYKIEKILSGRYFLVVNSENTNDCPVSHLKMFDIYSSAIKQIFGFNLENYKKQFTEINNLENTYYKVLTDEDESKYGGVSGQIDEYISIKREMNKKAEKLIESFPENFKSRIKLYSAYGKAFNFSYIQIEEGKTENQVTDFGITCI